MTPIISPWFFYWIEVSTNLIMLLITVGVGLVMGTFAHIAFRKMDREKPSPHCTRNIIIGMCLIVISAFLPMQETCYKMMAASVVTPDNIALVGSTAEDIVDYIVDSVDELLEDGKQSA